ncbi:MAG: ribosome maturation factor RimM [Tannerella sp.]|jgi:16S rRNA processing protein RimM|nr:ribosome maturation factor RimM [Tannerella sp.]
MLRTEDLIKIGYFAKPHGIKGEISLVTDYDMADLSGDDPYIVCEMEGIHVPFFIESYRPKNNTTALIGLAGIDSENKAKPLTGKPAYIPSDLLPPDDEDLPEWTRLTGYTVTDDRSGEIGTVSDIDDHTINVLLKVDYKGQEILIPAALITALERERKMIEVSLPDGFWEI